MLPADAETRTAAFELVRQALGARGAFSVEDRRRMDEVAQLFGTAPPNLALVPPAGTHAQGKSIMRARPEGRGRMR
jgi:hypothetical protein